MFPRFTLLTLTGTLLLTGCATPPAASPADDFATGSSVINVFHQVTPADDGSTVILTVDGKEAGKLKKGERQWLRVNPGKHQIAGYVPTLLGRVSIQGVEVTTNEQDVTHVEYLVKDKPLFKQAVRQEEEKTPQG
ncbi:hypothetical protein [Pantoea sp. 1.19]|uniref:hypothetical protein n=1 Tax=Pantoea sp. 1.19 TaxID=1925589 RepID=UPI000948FA00|nr:hypothetical protein [Pantoea sp. 1.19]